MPQDRATLAGVSPVRGWFPGESPAELPTRNSEEAEILLILGLGIIPTVIGHSALNHAMRHFRGQVVGIANLGQFVFAGVMAWIIFTEVPSWTLYAAAALVVAGVVLALRTAPPPQKKEEITDYTD